MASNRSLRYLVSQTRRLRYTTKSFAPREFSGYIGAGRRIAHESHKLAAARGVVWCWTCGKVAITKPRDLTAPCSGFANHFGQTTLARLRAGRPPFHLRDWPAGDDTVYRKLVVANQAAAWDPDM